MKNRNLIESLKNMLDGFIYSLKHESNLKIHFFIAIVVFALCTYLNLSAIEFCIVVIVIAFVIATEMINTAIEQTINLCWGHKIHPIAKIAKDIASLSVFVASVCAIIIGYLIVLPKFF